jgi:hypothetical protein
MQGRAPVRVRVRVLDMVQEQAPEAVQQESLGLRPVSRYCASKLVS